MQDKRKKIVLSVLGIITLILITVGVTYAVFTYTKLGTTENTVTTGTLKFLYTENTGVGNGISIENAFPVTDEVGKSYSTENYVFDFKVEGTNTGTEEIPYEVTLRKKSTSTLSESNVKVYLTDMTEDSDTEILEPTLYSNLTRTNIDVGNEIEKTIYKGTVAGGELTYLKEFRLRMWIDNNSNQDDINGKTFTAFVNVYSNVPLISEEEMASRNSTAISSLTVNGTEATAVEGQDYDYEIKVAEGTSSITINTETANNNTTVTVERIDSLAYNDTVAIKRLATSKTFDLTEGDNYFKITVTSENGNVTKEYKLKVYSIEMISIFGTKFKVIEAEPTLTTSSNNTSDASGLYKSTATNDGNPTYYFRGNVENNYVSFAGQTWRIVRINEDGTVRMIMQNGINNANYQFSSNHNNKIYMYYSNASGSTSARVQLNNWYTTNITNKGYDNKVVKGNYFCEQAKAAYSSDYASKSGTSMVIFSSYTPDFKCTTDTNGKGLVSASIGLITYDEVVFAGGYLGKSNSNYYLSNNTTYWTMSSAGFSGSYAGIWIISSSGGITYSLGYTYPLRPVINLKSNITVTGSGTSTDPYVVQ